MLPWHKLRQRIREDAAREAEPPYWAGNIPDGITVRKLNYDYFLTTEPGDKFTVKQSYVVIHSADGSIPYRAQRPAIAALHGTMTFPYQMDLANALADYAITTAAHQAGIEDHLRLRIERMDSVNWSILMENTKWEDEAPIRITPEGIFDSATGGSLPGVSTVKETGQSIQERLEEIIGSYRHSPYSIPEHHLDPVIQAAPEAPPAQRKRFKLFR